MNSVSHCVPLCVDSSLKKTLPPDWLLDWQVRSRCTSLWELELGHTHTQKKKKAIVSSRDQTGEKVFNYDKPRGRERGSRFKSSHFIWSVLEEASLIVPSGWAGFPQTRLDSSSVGSWRGVPSFTKYGGKPFNCTSIALATVTYSNNHLSFSVSLCVMCFFSFLGNCLIG